MSVYDRSCLVSRRNMREMQKANKIKIKKNRKIGSCTMKLLCECIRDITTNEFFFLSIRECWLETILIN